MCQCKHWSLHWQAKMYQKQWVFERVEHWHPLLMPKIQIWMKECFHLWKQMLKVCQFHQGKWSTGKDGNLPANTIMERNSGSTTTTITGRMTICFQLVEIDGNQCGNVNGWRIWLFGNHLPLLKRRLDKHIVWHLLFFHQTCKYDVISY